jgi:alpha-glucosidase
MTRNFFHLTVLLLFFIKASAQSNPSDTIKAGNPIIMVGNSITFQGDWKKVLNRNDVTNWGIPGYTTGQIAWTFKNFVKLQPKVCFLEGGINDISLGISPKRIYENQIKMIDSLQAHNIIPVMQSTIYQLNNKANNKKVTKTNRLIKAYCDKHHIDYIDLNKLFAPGKNLNAALTTDGTHLKPPAYDLWAKEITGELQKLGL